MLKSAVIVFRLALVLALAAVLVAAWQWWRYGHEPLVVPGARVSFEIRKGTGGRALTPMLRSAGVPVEPWELAAAWRLRGHAEQIKAGRYELEGPITLEMLLNQLIAGQPDKERTIVLIEGWTFRQVREALAKAPELGSTIAGQPDDQVMKRLNAEETHPEGLFAPDTYSYRLGSTDLELLARAYRLQKQRLETAWAQRAEDLAIKTPRELLVLASIVEKESGRREDRPMVASVFHNRLRIGMMMQSDPTTIYGLGERYAGNLTREHLRGDTPYNTYVRGGLTPTPIAMPGLGALEATARPAPSKALYFVSRGDGTSEFSADLASHNRAVNKYQRRLQ